MTAGSRLDACAFGGCGAFCNVPTSGPTKAGKPGA